MSACEHELPARVVGLPDDHEARHAAARATITRLTGASALAARRELAEAHLVVLELECARAELEARPAPAAELALRALAGVVGDDEDATLRAALFHALLRVGWARRLGAAPGRAKVDAEVAMIEAALVVAERPPCVDSLVARGLSQLVKSGQFQTEAAVRERAFAAGRELRSRYADTSSPTVAREVARGLEEWMKMLARGAPEREELAALRDRLARV